MHTVGDSEWPSGTGHDFAAGCHKRVARTDVALVEHLVAWMAGRQLDVVLYVRLQVPPVEARHQIGVQPLTRIPFQPYCLLTFTYFK